jgi:hypothetical protein
MRLAKQYASSSHNTYMHHRLQPPRSGLTHTTVGHTLKAAQGIRNRDTVVFFNFLCSRQISGDANPAGSQLLNFFRGCTDRLLLYAIPTYSQSLSSQ